MYKGLITVFIVGTLFYVRSPFPATAGQKKITQKGPAKADTLKGPAKSDTLSPGVSFKKDIFPVITKLCLPCHTEDQMNPSELYLDTYAGLMAGGKHGKPVIPGSADSSLIVEKLSGSPPFGDLMPLKSKKPISPDTVNLLKKWINEGAKDN